MKQEISLKLDENIIKENQELFELLKANTSSEEIAYGALLSCLGSTELYRFYKLHLNKDFYRNMFLVKVLKEEETLIDMVVRLATFLASSDQDIDRILANCLLRFINYSTDHEVRNSYRSILDEFHDLLKENHPNMVGEFTGRIKSLVSFLNKVLKDTRVDKVNDIYGFRFVLRANNHEKPQQLMSTLVDIVGEFIEFCGKKGFVTLELSTTIDNFSQVENPDVIIPDKATKEKLFEILKISKEKDGKLHGNGKVTMCYPKESGYQDIKIVVDTIVWGRFEMQFHTQKTFEYAENGPASHDQYKNEPLYNFLNKLVKSTNPDEDSTNFLGITASDPIYMKKSRHSLEKERTCPKIVSQLNLKSVEKDFKKIMKVAVR